MADIFLSYAKTDRTKVEPIVPLLEADGWQVWWDKRIGGGEQWDEVIEKELTDAKCVVVVWSADSILSRWVRSEANLALERQVLVPVIIDDVSPPLAFTLIQATDLTRWDTHPDSEAATSLRSAVRAKIGGPPVVPKPKRDRLIGLRPEPISERRLPAGGAKSKVLFASISLLGLGTVLIVGTFWGGWLPPSERNYDTGEKFQDCGYCPQMVVTRLGQFVMGEKDESSKWEGPPHAVSLRDALGVGRFEVTNQEYAVFLNEMIRSNRYDQGWALTDQEDARSALLLALRAIVIRTGYDNHPVAVSWRGAKAYVEWLSVKSGRRYRLPTEAEWEYLARAGSTAKTFFGVDISKYCEYGNVQDVSWQQKHPRDGYILCDDGYSGTAPVGRFKANAFDLYDVLGNVWEWVEDCWHNDYTGAPTDGTAWTDGGDCSTRVSRGGSFERTYFNVAARVPSPENRRLIGIGFRVVREVVQQPKNDQQDGR